MSENKIQCPLVLLSFQIKSPVLMNLVNISTNNIWLIKLVKLKNAAETIQGLKYLMCPQIKIYYVYEACNTPAISF